MATNMARSQLKICTLAVAAAVNDAALSLGSALQGTLWSFRPLCWQYRGFNSLNTAVQPCVP